MLNILIPQYKETEVVIKPLLDSIALQQGVDLGAVKIIICNDGSDVSLKRSFLSQYPLDITYCKQKVNAGCAATRNRLLDMASEDYVMFCDADDMFIDLFALNKIFLSFPFDALFSLFLEEAGDENGVVCAILPHPEDKAFNHGKVYRRQFLLDNALRWCEELPYNEDIAFNSVAMNLAEAVKYISSPLYLWRWNPASITRSCPDFRDKAMPMAIQANRKIVYALLTRKREDIAAYFCAWITCVSYYAANRLWNTEISEKIHDEFRRYYHKYSYLLEKYENFPALMQLAREKAIKDGFTTEHILFNDWIQLFAK